METFCQKPSTWSSQSKKKMETFWHDQSMEQLVRERDDNILWAMDHRTMLMMGYGIERHDYFEGSIKYDIFLFFVYYYFDLLVNL